MAKLTDYIFKPFKRDPTDGVEPISWLNWLVVSASMIATLTAWQMSLDGVKERSNLQFDRQADHAIDLFEEKMRRYADVLHASVGFLSGSAAIDPDEWHNFTDRMSLEERHPAISGLGVVYRVERDDLPAFVREQRKLRPEFQISPAVDFQSAQSQPYYLPLTNATPRELEKAALGLDIARESRRRDAIARAVEQGNVQITAPIQLGASKIPGFLLFAPFYRSDIPTSEVDRRQEFTGAVVGSVVTQQLAQNILRNDMRQVALKVSDGGEIMYNEQLVEHADVDPQPLLTRSKVVPFFGRDWRFDVQSTLAFRQAQSSLEPTLILFGGLLINALLLYLFVQMSQANRRAIVFGNTIADKYDRQSNELHQANVALEKRNEELRSFSYVVSHDLKSPLIGINALAECLKEDIEEHMPSIDSHPEFVRSLKLIQKQVTLSQRLIKGVLEYSGLGADEEHPETVCVLELLKSIRVMLAVEESQLQLVGEFPILKTYQTQLFQVFMNLISNGYKYNEGNEVAVVTVSVGISPFAGSHRFVVSDNGPGIDPKYHEKIFEVFSTLQPKNHSMSSGVGLGIVKKLVCQHGGEVQVESELGQGSTFLFDWPHGVERSASSGQSVLPKAA